MYHSDQPNRRDSRQEFLHRFLLSCQGTPEFQLECLQINLGQIRAEYGRAHCLPSTKCHGLSSQVGQRHDQGVAHQEGKFYTRMLGPIAVPNEGHRNKAIKESCFPSLQDCTSFFLGASESLGARKSQTILYVPEKGLQGSYKV